MADIRWDISSRTLPLTVLSTGLDSLANAAAALSAAVDNDTDLDLLFLAQLAVTFGTSPTDQAPVELWIARSLDSTTFEDASATGPIFPRNGFVDACYVRAVTTAQVISTREITMPWRDHKALVMNRSGQAFPASGSTLKYDLARLNVA